MVEITINTADEQQDGFIPNFFASGTGSIQQFFNQDNTIQALLRPVIPTTSGQFPWVDEYTAGDEFFLQLGNLDGRATGGTYTLEIDGYATAAIAWNQNLSQVQHEINLALASYGSGDVTVSLLSEGVYQLDWDDVGAITNSFTGNASNLQPECEIIVTQTRVGDASTKAQQIVEIRQTAVVAATFDTVFAATGIENGFDQPNSSQQNAIYGIDLGDVYAGGYTVTATAGGIVSDVLLSAEMTSEEIGIALAAHPAIYYQDTEQPDNISVEIINNEVLVTFIGALGGAESSKTITGISVANPTNIECVNHKLITGDSIVISGSNSTPAIDGTQTVTVIDADTFSIPVNVASAGTAGTFYATTQPKLVFANEFNVLYKLGFTGTINLNTVALAKAFWSTTDDSIEFPLQVKRVRTDGEERTILGQTVTLKRQLVNVSSLTPTPSLQQTRKGTVTCSTTDSVTVTFANPMPNATYSILECSVEFTPSGSPVLKLVPTTFDDITASGFTVYLNGDADTSYRIRYLVAGGF